MTEATSVQVSRVIGHDIPADETVFIVECELCGGSVGEEITGPQVDSELIQEHLDAVHPGFIFRSESS